MRIVTSNYALTCFSSPSYNYLLSLIDSHQLSSCFPENPLSLTVICSDQYYKMFQDKSFCSESLPRFKLVPFYRLDLVLISLIQSDGLYFFDFANCFRVFLLSVLSVRIVRLPCEILPSLPFPPYSYSSNISFNLRRYPKQFLVYVLLKSLQAPIAFRSFVNLNSVKPHLTLDSKIVHLKVNFKLKQGSCLPPLNYAPSSLLYVEGADSLLGKIVNAQILEILSNLSRDLSVSVFIKPRPGESLYTNFYLPNGLSCLDNPQRFEDLKLNSYLLLTLASSCALLSPFPCASLVHILAQKANNPRDRNLLAVQSGYISSFSASSAFIPDSYTSLLNFVESHIS